MVCDSSIESLMKARSKLLPIRETSFSAQQMPELRYGAHVCGRFEFGSRCTATRSSASRGQTTDAIFTTNTRATVSFCSQRYRPASTSDRSFDRDSQRSVLRYNLTDFNPRRKEQPLWPIKKSTWLAYSVIVRTLRRCKWTTQVRCMFPKRHVKPNYFRG